MNRDFNRDEFDKVFRENRELYYDEPEKAHEKQVEHVKKLDDYTGGKSRYDSSSGVWYLSDGRQSDEMDNGIIGNSYYNDKFNRKNTQAYRIYKDNYKKYSEKEFSYDAEKDPLYKTYKKQYNENSQKIMDDVIAKSAAKTGGIAGSYAVTAGAAAANDYMRGLDDVLSTLEDKAYSKYEDEKEDYLKKMSIAKDEMAEDEAAWRYNNAVIKSAEKENKEKESEYNSALRKFQSEGKDAMNDNDWKAVYAGGGWFNPDEGLVYDAKGNSFAPKKKEDGYRAVIGKFQNDGWSALSDEEKKIALNNGWYDASTGYLYDSAGNAYAPIYSNEERALAKYKAKGLGKLTEDELLILENAGYKVRNGILLNASGYAV